jgi:cytochrome d ubiquinol oxidase subunit I
MVPSDLVVELSRWQFAATALYHFLFVPLTLGLSFILAAMETVYVVTGRQIYKDMAMFWGKLFAINFALGVATGLTMEFEFGTNWSTYSYYVGDIFGAPLAVEGLMAFFMESTFVGMMLLGWHRLTRVQHLTVTWLVALGSNLSALWILVANGFMQDPTGAAFNPLTQRMELTSFMDLIFNPDAQAKFVHTSMAGYVTGALFVVGISAWYLGRGRHVELARRSLRMAALFGVIASVGVISLGDALGFINGTKQPMKLAAMEGLWQTEQAPAPFNLVAFPSQSQERNLFQIQVPYVLSILVAHNFSTPIKGIKELQQEAAKRIENGIPALTALQALQKNPGDTQALAQFNAHKQDLGYAYLVKRYAPDVSAATPAQIEKAVDRVLGVPPHGRLGLPDAVLPDLGHPAVPAWPGNAQPGIPQVRSLDDSGRLSRLRNGLGHCRDRASALERVSPVADVAFCLHAQCCLHGLLADWLRDALQHLHRCRDVSDVQVRPQGS